MENKTKCYCGHTIYCDCTPLEEPKQETLEEIAYMLYPIVLEDDEWDKNKQYRDEWIEGAKWQQEQNKNLYTEEDMIEFADFYYQYKELIKLEKWEIIEISKKDVFKKWFEQYKRNKL